MKEKSEWQNEWDNSEKGSSNSERGGQGPVAGVLLGSQLLTG